MVKNAPKSIFTASHQVIKNNMQTKIQLAVATALGLSVSGALGQTFDISTFEVDKPGPWSNRSSTTLMVPKVPNGSITGDGAVSAAEYGGFVGVNVTPGVNAWILDWPSDRTWDGPEDSSFTFYLAHDDDYLYVGVDTKDDVVTSDDPNRSFWKDDSIEIVVDALLDRFDNNTDNSKDPFGGHSYVNYEGRFSSWDETANAIGNTTWSTAVDWKYGAAGDVFGFGKATPPGGWKMEVRFKKRLFEDPAAGNKLRNGYIMGFNIGLDDDDKKGQGELGDKSRGQDLELQYFWSNRQRYSKVDAAYLAKLTPEDRNLQVWRTDPDNHPLIIDSAGRLSHGGTGEIIFGYDADKKSSGKILFVTSDAANPINADAGLIALLRAKGYTVTVVQTPMPAPDDFRAAAAGQDVVLISETIGSGSVLEPVGDPVVQKFILRDTDVPVISWEAFMWDNAEWVAHPETFDNEFSFFGNTGRTEDSQPSEIKNGRDSITIRKADHPIAGGLTGNVKVYNTHYSFNYGRPSADADVVASVQPDGTFPTLFVYDKGDKLIDGSTVPNKRIGLHLGQAASMVANWGPDIRDMTENGKNLLFNAINYAIGSKGTPKISIARKGADIVITYEGGALQSSSTVNGTYTPVAGVSPLTISNPSDTKFYRVR